MAESNALSHTAAPPSLLPRQRSTPPSTSAPPLSRDPPRTSSTVHRPSLSVPSSSPLAVQPRWVVPALLRQPERCQVQCASGRLHPPARDGSVHRVRRPLPPPPLPLSPPAHPTRIRPHAGQCPACSGQLRIRCRTRRAVVGHRPTRRALPAGHLRCHHHTTHAGAPPFRRSTARVRASSQLSCSTSCSSPSDWAASLRNDRIIACEIVLFVTCIILGYYFPSPLGSPLLSGHARADLGGRGGRHQ